MEPDQAKVDPNVFWLFGFWIASGLLALLFLTVVALGVAWAFYLLVGLFP